MENFWDYSVWGTVNLLAILLISLLIGNFLKRTIKGLRNMLIPTSVISGAILLIIGFIYKLATGTVMFDTAFFGGRGMANLEMITYHTLALGFIASALKSAKGKLTKKRTAEIFNTGVTTVSTYLLQAIVGIIITIVAAFIIKGFFQAAGVLLPFGYGQGTGQALNYGNIYETEYGFVGGKSFGLTIAALGFISASIGGVIHLNVLKKRGVITVGSQEEKAIRNDEIHSKDDIPMQESVDKMTIQIALIIGTYFIAYLLMLILGSLLPGMKSVIYGFNFLLGVLAAALVKGIVNVLRRKNVIKKEYKNDFLLTRTSNFFFDIMVVAGIAAIRLEALKESWVIIIILAVVGTVVTFIYNRVVANTLFSEYKEEQFLMMYGMMTGTASTGTMLLREIDGEFKTPVADNMVYQNFPAIVFGFPMMLLATLAPKKLGLALLIFVVFFAVMNIILFRSKIFKKKK